MVMAERDVYIACCTAFSWLINNGNTLMQNIPIREFLRRSLAIAKQESSFDSDAKNPSSTATGLFQVLKGTRRSMEKRLKLKKTNQDALKKPTYAAIIGLAYFAYQFQRYKTFDKAVIAYHRGSYSQNADTSYYKTHEEKYGSLDFATIELGLLDTYFPNNYTNVVIPDRKEFL
jgi:hypothetical protein